MRKGNLSHISKAIKERANAIQKYTGISGTVYFCTKKECKNIQAHALGSVKLISNGKSVSVSIKKDKNGKRIVSGTNRGMIRDLVKFVELNENILWKYWNMPPEEADLVETIKKFIKV